MIAAVSKHVLLKLNSRHRAPLFLRANSLCRQLCFHTRPERGGPIPNNHTSATSSGNGLLSNKILAALPSGEYEQIASMLRPVSLELGETLYMPDQKIEYVYFINRGVVSLLATLENGATVEAGVMGSEGAN